MRHVAAAPNEPSSPTALTRETTPLDPTDAAQCRSVQRLVRDAVSHLERGGFTVTPRLRQLVESSISERDRNLGYWLGLKRRRVPILLVPNDSGHSRPARVSVLDRMILAVCGIRIWSWVMQKRGLEVM